MMGHNVCSPAQQIKGKMPPAPPLPHIFVNAACHPNSGMTLFSHVKMLFVKFIQTISLVYFQGLLFYTEPYVKYL